MAHGLSFSSATDKSLIVPEILSRASICIKWSSCKIRTFLIYLFTLENIHYTRRHILSHPFNRLFKNQWQSSLHGLRKFAASNIVTFPSTFFLVFLYLIYKTTDIYLYAWNRMWVCSIIANVFSICLYIQFKNVGKCNSKYFRGSNKKNNMPQVCLIKEVYSK